MKRVIYSTTSDLKIRDGKHDFITIDEISDKSFYNEYGSINTFSGVSVYKGGEWYCSIFKSGGSGYQRGGDTELVITRTPKTYLYYCELMHSAKRKRFKTIEDVKVFLHTI